MSFVIGDFDAVKAIGLHVACPLVPLPPRVPEDFQTVLAKIWRA